MARKATEGEMVFIIPLIVLMVVMADLSLLLSPLLDQWHFVLNNAIETPCAVVDRGTRHVGGRGGGTRYFVTFRYNVDGVDYTASDGVTESFYEDHPKGTETRCFYSPVSHGQALLPERHKLVQPFPLELVAVLTVFNVFAGGLACWWPSLVRKQYLKRFGERRPVHRRSEKTH